MGNRTLAECEAKKIKLLCYLRKCRDEAHYVPSMREISREVGMSVSTIHKYMQVMQQNGYITSTEGVTRSTVLTDKGEALINDILA